ncbi:hypothetical protein WICMUC_002141 [Wickerhamomyces mucosus]|uniref:Octanoyltransferase n=1 Tax=Wickerhamomyces mucosus TaxID=1378264 RepID=A0A9P8TEW9_9ASCO|nr:hypothetical protein WICMUC_002141 [Wickerhamomyces mucosus]
MTSLFSRSFNTSSKVLQEVPKNCTKFYPVRPSAKTLRHLRFTVPLDYSKGSNIQEKFCGAFLEFKKMQSKIERKYKELEAQNLTTNEYETQLLSSILEMKPSPTILSFEFNSIITAGRREKYRLTDANINSLKDNTGYDFIQTNRGGEITFHNHGQLVIYPIFDLKDFHNLTIKCFVSQLEDSVISTLDKFDIKGHKTDNTGVWINDNNKISSIGLQVSRSVTSHGISINVNNEIPDLEGKTGFPFCGLPGKTQTSMKEQLRNDVKVNEVSTQFVRELAKKLNIEQIESVDLDDLQID